MTSLSEEKLNFIKLNYVLTPHATEVLRELFRKKWFGATKKMWTDEQTKEFIRGKGKEIFVSASRRQKMLLEIGRLDLWDFHLLITILLKFDFGAATNPDKREKKLISWLAEIHADFRRNNDNSISNKEFNTAWDLAENILVKLGDSSDEKSKPKKTDQLLATNVDTATIPDSIASTFRKVGNEFFSEGNVIKAIKSYSQGIDLRPCKAELAILYSNRATARLKLLSTPFFDNLMNLAALAKQDLKNSIELSPIWCKSHYRLGCIYRRIGKDKQARTHLEVAVALAPNNNQIKERLDEVPVVPLSEEDFLYCDPMDDETFLANEMINAMRGGSDLVVWRATCFLCGWKVEKDEKMAEKLFLQATNDDRALIALSIMYLEGRGRKLEDKKKCVPFLLKVVNRSSHVTPPLARAEYILAWCFHKGIGVVVNLQQAVMWHKKAFAHGFTESALHLRDFYMNGSGVERNELKAAFYGNMAVLDRFCELFSGFPFAGNLL